MQTSRRPAPFPNLHKALAMALSLVVALAFGLARAEACVTGPGCCETMVLPCPMLAGEAGQAAKSLCKTLCAVLPSTDDRSEATGRPVLPGPAIGNAVGTATTGPEPPPPRTLA